MKKLIALFLICSLLTGCANLKGESSIIQESLAESGDINVDKIRINIDDIDTPLPSSPVVFDNNRENYTEEEAAKIIEDIAKFSVSEDFMADVPKQLDRLSTFDVVYPAYDRTKPEEKYRDFLAIFKYLFPNYEFKEQYVRLTANGDFEYFSGIYDDFFSGTDKYEDYPEFVYEEKQRDPDLPHTGYITDPLPYEPDAPQDVSGYNVALSAIPPFGSTYCTFNRGVLARAAFDTVGGDMLLLTDDFDYIGEYYPDSEEKFRLLDKEISIKDAVDIFENYINTIPVSVTPAYNIHVNKVQVYQITDECYGYNYITSRLYDEVPFEPVGTDGSDIVSGTPPVQEPGIGFMIKSDEVDYAYNIFRGQTIENEQQYTGFIPFDKAVACCAENLTEHIDFEAVDVRLVYILENSGKVNVLSARPVWKFTLFNPNDALYYICYQSALDEKELSYYTTVYPDFTYYIGEEE